MPQSACNTGSPSSSAKSSPEVQQSQSLTPPHKRQGPSSSFLKRGGSSCKYCGHDVNGSSTSVSDWVEHWNHIIREIDQLNEKINILDSNMNSFTKIKRAFQKLYEERWGVPPPEIGTLSSRVQWHGYIADYVRLECEQQEIEKVKHSLSFTNGKSMDCVPKQPSPPPVGAARRDPTPQLTPKTGRAVLKRVFSMSTGKLLNRT
eukprot:3934579-Rhodomonas_salina.2